MNWIVLSLLSALFLGCYDVFKKVSVKGNAVPPVLLVNVTTAAAIWLGILLASSSELGVVPELLQFRQLTMSEHGFLFMKSSLVGLSWTCAFFALKHLPISIATPIRATSPLWTVLIAVALIGERPTGRQAIGICVILSAFVAFSLVGRKEGIKFHKDRWVALMLAATLLGAASALYDKFLLQNLKLPPAAVQAWFSIYLVPVMLPLWCKWLYADRKSSPFEFRTTIPLIAVTLLIADFCYFTAISEQDALISIISPIRRTSIAIPFLYGVVVFGESNWKPKLICIVGILLGVLLLI